MNEQTTIDSDILSISPDRDIDIVKALASMPRMQILRLLRHRGPLNVNEISEALDLPQSTVATNVQALESCGLIETQAMKANKGRQKICYACYGEILIRFDDPPLQQKTNLIEVAMPIGLHQLQRFRPLRPVLGGGSDRTARRARLFPGPQPHEGVAEQGSGAAMWNTSSPTTRAC